MSHYIKWLCNLLERWLFICNCCLLLIEIYFFVPLSLSLSMRVYCVASHLPRTDFFQQQNIVWSLFRTGGNFFLVFLPFPSNSFHLSYMYILIITQPITHSLPLITLSHSLICLITPSISLSPTHFPFITTPLSPRSSTLKPYNPPSIYTRITPHSLW